MLKIYINALKPGNGTWWISRRKLLWSGQFYYVSNFGCRENFVVIMQQTIFRKVYSNQSSKLCPESQFARKHNKPVHTTGQVTRTDFWRWPTVCPQIRFRCKTIVGSASRRCLPLIALWHWFQSKYHFISRSPCTWRNTLWSQKGFIIFNNKNVMSYNFVTINI